MKVITLDKRYRTVDKAPVVVHTISAPGEYPVVASVKVTYPNGRKTWETVAYNKFGVFRFTSMIGNLDLVEVE